MDALVLERRVHGGHLATRAAEPRQRLRQLGLAEGQRSLTHHLTIGVGSIGTLAQAGDDTIALVGIQQKLRKLGRLTQANRQHSGRQRIQRTGMPRLVGIIDALYLLQHIVRGDPLPFIQQQDAINITAAATGSRHYASSSRSAALRRAASSFTTLLTRLDMRIPSTSEAS